MRADFLLDFDSNRSLSNLFDGEFAELRKLSVFLAVGSDACPAAPVES